MEAAEQVQQVRLEGTRREVEWKQLLAAWVVVAAEELDTTRRRDPGSWQPILERGDPWDPLQLTSPLVEQELQFQVEPVPGLQVEQEAVLEPWALEAEQVCCLHPDSSRPTQERAVPLDQQRRTSP